MLVSFTANTYPVCILVLSLIVRVVLNVQKSSQLAATLFSVSEVAEGLRETQCDFKVSTQVTGCDGVNWSGLTNVKLYKSNGKSFAQAFERCVVKNSSELVKPFASLWGKFVILGDAELVKPFASLWSELVILEDAEGRL